MTCGIRRSTAPTPITWTATSSRTSPSSGHLRQPEKLRRRARRPTSSATRIERQRSHARAVGRGRPAQLHGARPGGPGVGPARGHRAYHRAYRPTRRSGDVGRVVRSEEHTSELQSQSNLVCRLLLEKKKKQQNNTTE